MLGSTAPPRRGPALGFASPRAAADGAKSPASLAAPVKGVTYAYLGPKDEAAKFAKKGTESDIVLYNAKQGDTHLNIVSPLGYPERMKGLLATLDLAEQIIFQPPRIDKELGEMVVGASLFGKTKGFLRPAPDVDANQLKAILAKTDLKGLEFIDAPDGVFRERLYEPAAAATEGPVVIPIDHSFAVKGVGTVILGLVRSGKVEAHQKLQAYPTDTVVEIRSIQVHDVDFKEAPTGSRVGMAVKGVEPEKVSRGIVLAPPGSLKIASGPAAVRVKVHYSPFNKWEPRQGAVLHLYHCLQDVPIRVDGVTGDGLELRAESPWVIVPGQPMVLVDFDNKQQRFVGRATPI